MIIHNCKQRSEPWFNLRLGKITGSNAHKLTTKTKFEKYFCELLAETITRNITEGHVNEAMQWGIDNEPYAAEWYEEATQQEVQVCGFVEDEENIFGCSPDLLIGDKGMAQIKCPSSKNHLYYRSIDMSKATGDEKEILYQIQWELFVCQREWSDFITYDPRFKKKLIGHIQRIERNEKMISMLLELAETMQDRIQMFLFDHDIVPIRYVPAPEAPPANDSGMWTPADYLRA